MTAGLLNSVFIEVLNRMNRWIGKSVVVTGASSGIGEAIAKSLAIAGMNVIGLARREERLEELSKKLKNVNGSFEYRCCDVRNENDILKAFENVENKFGRVDVLVNNAGIALTDTIGEANTEVFRTILEVNVLGAAICTREAMKSMRKQKAEGHIFNINSVLGLYTSYQYSNINLYSASKFALRSMTDTVKNEITRNKDNIRITGIHPGRVKTEIARHTGKDDEIYKNFPYIESEQVADCVVFALSAPPGTQVGQIVITPIHERL